MGQARALPEMAMDLMAMMGAWKAQLGLLLALLAMATGIRWGRNHRLRRLQKLAQSDGPASDETSELVPLLELVRGLQKMLFELQSMVTEEGAQTRQGILFEDVQARIQTVVNKAVANSNALEKMAQRLDAVHAGLAKTAANLHKEGMETIEDYLQTLKKDLQDFIGKAGQSSNEDLIKKLDNFLKQAFEKLKTDLQASLVTCTTTIQGDFNNLKKNQAVFGSAMADKFQEVLKEMAKNYDNAMKVCKETRDLVRWQQSQLETLQGRTDHLPDRLGILRDTLNDTQQLVLDVKGLVEDVKLQQEEKAQESADQSSPPHGAQGWQQPAPQPTPVATATGGPTLLNLDEQLPMELRDSCAFEASGHADLSSRISREMEQRMAVLQELLEEESSQRRERHQALVEIAPKPPCLMATPSSEVVVFDGEEFRISQRDVRGHLLMPPWMGFGLAGALGMGVQKLCKSGGFQAAWLCAPGIALLGIVGLAAAFFKDTFKRFEAKLIPFLMKQVDHHFLPIRKELLKGIKGDVLDVGCGDGMYLPYYVESCRRVPRGGVRRALMLEPNIHLHPALRANVQAAKDQISTMDWMEVEMTSAFLEDLPPTEQFDSIVFGNVLCEVPCQKDFFRAVDAHLKPGGRVYFSEHVLSEFPLLRLLQHAVSPAWVCHCNRDSIEHLSAQPWVEELRTWSFAGTFPVCRWEMGIAVKRRGRRTDVEVSGSHDAFRGGRAGAHALAGLPCQVTADTRRTLEVREAHHEWTSSPPPLTGR
ncbi:hypothetical protein AK812_SmicGene8012 [Symbiodinium microadriaticum]|uniref:Uncharacterized protein n=1 Tax=Symbiodinium microadriaticum TaxID=2951 RepID=A0A1Q9EM31_SYMMI|nr:hypothetical protein AK812_SmicGene8012 [Symbiodinium microadriaticum]